MNAPAVFDWTTALFSAGSVAFGILLTLVGQALADGRLSRREISARRDQLRLQAYQDDRDSMKAMAQLLADSYRLMFDYTRAFDLDTEPDAPLDWSPAYGLKERDQDIYTRDAPIYYRLRSTAAADACKLYWDACNVLQNSATYGDLLAAYDDLAKPYEVAQGAIGLELRKDPLEDIGASPRKIRRGEARAAEETVRRRELLQARELDDEPVDKP